MTTYTVTFDRVGRSHPGPMTFEDVSDADELAALVLVRVRPLLASRGVDVLTDLEAMTGKVLTGFRSAGSFTIEETDR